MGKKFSKDHEWVSVESDFATIGITDYAQKQLGDIVFVEMPNVGINVESGAEVGVVESVKAASEIFTPVSGTITSVNEKLENKPELVNVSPEIDGWMFKVKLSNIDELNSLMDQKDYNNWLDELN